MFSQPLPTVRIQRGSRRMSLARLRPFLAVLCLALPALAQAADKTWDGGGDGASWSDALNWNPDGVPASGDNVTISVAGSPSITLNGSATVGAFNCDEPFTVLGGTFSVTTANINADFTLNNSTISGGAWTVTSRILPTANSNNLITGAAITGDLVLLANSARVRIGPGTTFTRARFQGTGQALGFLPGSSVAGQILHESSANADVEMVSAGTLIFTATAQVRPLSTGTLRIGGSQWWGGAMTLENLGLIADDAGPLGSLPGISVSAAVFNNRGIVRATGGGDVVLGTDASIITNRAADPGPPALPAGQISVGGASRVTIGGDWSNQGAIDVGPPVNSIDATLRLSQSYARADLGALTNLGSVEFDGVLNNSGGTLTLAAGGSYTLRGQITGGTLNHTANRIRFTNTATRLTDVEIIGNDLVLDVSSSRLRVEGTTRFPTLRLIGSGSSVGFSPGYTLRDAVVAEGPNNKFVEMNGGNGTLTIAPGGSIATASGPPGMPGTTDMSGTLTIGASQWFGGVMTLVNQGAITHSGSGTLALSAQIASFTNAGGANVSATGAGTLTVEPQAWSNQGTISFSTGGTFTLGGAWNNTGGTFNFTNSTVNLGGTFSTAQLGTINRTDGTVNITGTLNNTGATLALTDTTGPWQIRGGQITGGTVTQAGAGALTPAANSVTTLQDVTLSQPLLLSGSSSRVRILGATQIALIRLAGNACSVGFAPGTVWAGTVRCEGAGGTRYIETTANGTWTLGPTGKILADATFTGTARLDAQWFATPALINQGEISLVGAGTGATLTLGGSGFTNSGTGAVRTNGNAVTIAATTVANQGLLDVANAQLALTTPWSNAGGTIALAGGPTTPGVLRLEGAGALATLGSITRTGTTRVDVAGTFELGGGTLTLNAASGNWTMAGGTLQNGTVRQLGGVLEFGNAVATLTNITAPEEINLAALSARARVLGGAVAQVRLTGGGSGVGLAAGSTFGGTIIADGTSGTRYIETATAGTLTFGPGAQISNSGGVALTIGQSQWFSQATTVTNRGTITSAVNGQTVRIASDVFNNESPGVYQSQNGGLLDIAAPTWSNTGTITLTAGSTFTFAGNWSNAGGTINATNATVNAGGTFTRAQLGNFNRTGGVLNINGTLNNTGATLDLTSAFGDVTLAGGQILGGTVNQSAGRLRFTNNNANRLTNVALVGDVLVDAISAAVRIEGGTSFARLALRNVGARVMLPSGFVIAGEVLADGPGGSRSISLENAGDLTVGGAGRLAVASGVTLVLGSGSFTSGALALVNQGTVDVATTGTLTFGSDSSLKLNAGTLGSGTFITRGTGRVSYAAANTPVITRIGAGTTLDLEGAVSGGSPPFPGLGTLERVDGVVQLVGPDQAITPGTGTLLLNGRMTAGAGTRFSVTGALVMGPGAELGAALDGPAVSQQGDMVVSGSAAVDGTLRVTSATGYQPGCGLRYRPLDAATLTGTFDAVILPPAGAGSVITLAYDPGGVGVRGFVGVSGFSYADFNQDGIVDDGDFVLFALAYNEFVCPAQGPCPADLDGTGIVDDIDFVLFAIAYDAFVCP